MKILRIKKREYRDGIKRKTMVWVLHMVHKDSICIYVWMNDDGML